MFEKSYSIDYLAVKRYLGKNTREEEFPGSAAGIRA